MRCKLGDISEITKLAGYEFTKYIKYIPDGEIIAVRALNLKNGTLVLDDIQRISKEVSETLLRSQLHKNDIVLSYTGTLGECAQIREEGKYHLAPNVCKITPNDSAVNPNFLFQYIRCDKFKQTLINYAHGSTQPTIPMSTIRDIPVDIPDDLEKQGKIAAILSALDEKIATNRAINDNLQQQVSVLFKSWFVDRDPWDGIQPSEWTNAPLGTFVEIKRGGSPRPIQDYLSDSGLRWLKISDVTSLSSPFVLEIKEHIKEEGLKKTVFLHAGELVLSNSATPGIPKILDVDTCIHDGWLYFPKSELSKYYLYLFFKHIRKELVSLGNGSVFTNLKTDILKAFPATKADKVTLKKFDALVSPLFDAILNADRENLKLATMRDSLLPRLMSGEIDVSAVQL